MIQRLKEVIYYYIFTIVPRYFVEAFANKLKIDEIKDELIDVMDLETEKKMTPRKIKEELDKYVIGQEHVKRAIAIGLSKLCYLFYFSLGSRYRKRMLPKTQTENMRSHNMLISGKSGSGKTELLRQTAKICNTPFIKVDAVRYTEVGYHGDDVENIVSDLYKKTKNEFFKNLRFSFWKLKSVKKAWEFFILQYYLGKGYESHVLFNSYKEKLHSGELDTSEVQIWFIDVDRVEKYTISDIKNYFFRESIEKLSEKLDFDDIIKRNIEERAIICIDEFDKLVKDKNVMNSSKASDEGVQNDFLPLFDGTDVPITEGKKTQLFVNTRNILFVALGAFAKTKPGDLIVEIQGRLPNQTEVKPLTKVEYVRILKETKDNILTQAIRSIKTEGINLVFTEKAIEEMAYIAEEVNRHDEDTGARRLVSVLDTILEDINFGAPEIHEEYQQPGKNVM